MSETYSYKGYEIEIEQDVDAESSREWDNLGTMYCEHSRYELGDKDAEDIRDMDSEYPFRNFDGIILPLYLYDHSGISMSTSTFSCSWDSGQVGYIYVSNEKIRQEFNVKRISKQLRQRIFKYLIGEVKTYDQYLTGQVYGYQISHNDDDLDSCWGFYGDEPCREEAENMVDYLVIENTKKRQARLKTYIRNHVPLEIRV